MQKLSQQDFIQRAGDWIEQTAGTHDTLIIESPSGNAVMISEEDWQAMNRILQVASMSAMARSIRSDHGESRNTS